MGVLAKVNTLRKGVLLYRGIRYRRGFGVHSPFVFNLISKVIDERNPYYSFENIELVRLGFKFDETIIQYKDIISQKNKKTSIGNAIYKNTLSSKKGALLFRLANYFKAKNILQIGSGMGIPTLYLTSYSSNINCLVLESEESFSDVAKRVIKKGSNKDIEVMTGEYTATLQETLLKLKNIDIVYFDTHKDSDTSYKLFEQCLKYTKANSIFIINGIKANKNSRELWKKICDNDKVTVSIDIYSMGIVVFNPKLHKKNYIVYF
jgi:predicted O-methyltransferase YrrM